MTVFCKFEHPSEEKDIRARQSPMKTVTLILPLKAMTVNNPSVSSAVTVGAVAVVNAGALID